MVLKTVFNYLGDGVKRIVSSPRAKTLAFVLSICCGTAVAQNSAGDYSAGTTALTTVADEVAKYIPIVVKLCYALAGVVAIIGAISVYIAMNNQLFKLLRTCFESLCKTLEISIFGLKC